MYVEGGAGIAVPDRYIKPATGASVPTRECPGTSGECAQTTASTRTAARRPANAPWDARNERRLWGRGRRACPSRSGSIWSVVGAAPGEHEMNAGETIGGSTRRAWPRHRLAALRSEVTAQQGFLVPGLPEGLGQHEVQVQHCPGRQVALG